MLRHYIIVVPFGPVLGRKLVIEDLREGAFLVSHNFILNDNFLKIDCNLIKFSIDFGPLKIHKLSRLTEGFSHFLGHKWDNKSVFDPSQKRNFLLRIRIARMSICACWSVHLAVFRRIRVRARNREKSRKDLQNGTKSTPFLRRPWDHKSAIFWVPSSRVFFEYLIEISPIFTDRFYVPWTPF